MLAVVGGRGGAGASVFAVATAVRAARSGERALLVDCDPLGGGVDLVLGAEDLDGLRWPEVGTGAGTSGLRLAAIERGVVMAARDLGKLKTWSQAVAAALGGFAAAGLWSDSIGWWALLVALILTWISGLDYARIAPRVLRGTA